MDLAQAAALLRCPDCEAEKLSLTIFDQDEAGQTRNGLLRCAACGVGHRVEDAVADLLPTALKHPARTRAFAARWKLAPPAEVAAAGGYEPQKEQIEFFRTNVRVYDAEVSRATYYRLSDRMTFHRWLTRLTAPGVVFDIASGTGRQSERLLAAGHEVFAVDLSEEMHRQAQRNIAAPRARERLHLFLADAGRLPFRSAVADAVICFGSMHHFPDHRAFLAEASRLLKPGGLWYSYDPHHSPLRFLFEGAMRFWKLYDECAAPDPLFTAEKLTRLCTAAGLEVEIRYHTFLLPHLVHLLGERGGGWALEATDACFSRLPLVQRCAGIIISEGIKKAS